LQVRFGQIRTIEWYRSKNAPKTPTEPTIKVMYDDDEIASANVKRAVTSITGAYDKFPKGAVLVLGKEDPQNPKSIYGFFGTPTMKNNLHFESPQQNIKDDMSAVRHILNQVGRQMDIMA